jgi:hypothetical protein
MVLFSWHFLLFYCPLFILFIFSFVRFLLHNSPSSAVDKFHPRCRHLVHCSWYAAWNWINIPFLFCCLIVIDDQSPFFFVSFVIQLHPRLRFKIMSWVTKSYIWTILKYSWKTKNNKLQFVFLVYLYFIC